MTESDRMQVARQAAILAACQTFLAADSLATVMSSFEEMAEAAEGCNLMQALKPLNHHKVKQLLSHLDVLLDAGGSRPLRGQQVVVIGAGPGGLRTAIQASCLGAEVTIVERRPEFTRHNVLKLWPGVVDDLLGLGLKVLQPKFGTTGSEKISIRRLQLVLLKIALLLGSKVVLEDSFFGITPPSDDDSRWSVSLGSGRELQCNVLVGSDGENSLVAKAAGFESSFTQFSKSIGVTFNFEKSANPEETRLKEFSRSKQFYGKWFQEVEQRTGVSLENFVYFKDETHYFVMAASHQSLIAAGVLKEEKPTPRELVSSQNQDPLELCLFARRMAELVGLPKDIAFAQGARGPDIGVFDFTAKRASATSTKLLEAKTGQQLLITLVGDAAVAPFWPLGTGANKAILGAFDSTKAMVDFASLGKGAPHDKLLEMLQQQYNTFISMKQLMNSSGTRPNASEADAGVGTKPGSGRKNRWSLDPESRYSSIASSRCPEKLFPKLLVLLEQTSLPMLEASDPSGPDLLEVMSCDTGSMSAGCCEMLLEDEMMEEESHYSEAQRSPKKYAVPKDIAEWLACHPDIKDMADLRKVLLASERG
eukprot:TRINITY_DN110707_c0_g1_i1.p1 TRINITY_DN110707_c0_g1~~TRINITY_DN110707_c0_g1_i1.p1  ORF type:complete len:592 (+),score=119.03 TRINITY_DN110707_c0_g1_i1:70-1845(+)